MSTLNFTACCHRLSPRHHAPRPATALHTQGNSHSYKPSLASLNSTTGSCTTHPAGPITIALPWPSASHRATVQ
jgi:hypothetical protein